jgi:pilus assembly protein CpaC
MNEFPENKHPHLVIGGLIKNNSTANIKAFPVLGELPVLGALFRSTDFQNDKTELVFVVTPRLVKPLPLPNKLPTDGLREPSRRELFIDGKLEGNRENQRESQRENQRESESRASPRDTNTGFELK